jgi:hypothetical protein
MGLDWGVWVVRVGGKTSIGEAKDGVPLRGGGANDLPLADRARRVV